MAEALDALVAVVCKPQGQPQQVEAAVKRLVAAFGSRAASSGKENTSTKQLKAAALQCFKAAQAQLADGRGGSSGSTAVFVGLGQASLRALEAHAGGAAAAAQLLPLRYNFVKRLAAAGSYSAAWQEAVTLREQLGGGGLPRTVEAANMAVGAVLMLLLCCVEGKAAAGDWLLVSLEATQGLEEWLRVLPQADAEKHRDAVFKYLYKAGVHLLEAKEWDQLPSVMAAMAGIAVSEGHLQRVLQATHKFAAHMPDAVAAEAAAAAATALIGCTGQLPGSVPQEVVSLLCMACQRATSADAASHVWAAVVQCSSMGCGTLQQAALLLPALAASQGTVSDGWVQPVVQATALASASTAALQQARGADAQRHASVVAAAFQAANLLRKVLANQLVSWQGGACEALGSSQAVVAVAAALDMLGGLVATARALAAITDDAALGAAMGTVGSQVHTAAVGLGTAVKLRAVYAARPGASPVVDAAALAAVLGWDFSRYCSSGGQLPSGSGVLSGQELCWLAAALNNVGVDLHGEGLYEAATPALLAAVSASICSLTEAIAQGPGVESVAQRARELAKRSSALSDAQHKAGAPTAAVATLAHSVAALAQCGLGATAWGDLLGRCVKVVHLLLSEQQEAGAAIPAHAPKGRGSRAAKAAASKGKAGGALGREAPAQLSCSKVLSEHSEWIPAAARASVAAQELSMWAALASDSGSGSSVAGAHTVELCSYLLEEAFPAEQCPEGHVCVLVAAYQAGISAGELAGKELLSRAAAVLDRAKQDGAEAAILAAKVHGLMALGAAQQLVEQSMEEQRQQRQQQRAQQAAAPSSSPGSLGAGSSDSQPGSLNTEAWQEVAAQAGVALEHTEALLADNQPLQPDDVEPLCHLVAELCYMAALQGEEQAEATCQRLCQDLLSLAGHALSDNLVQWAAITAASGCLTSCLLPGIRPAMAQCTASLEQCLEAWPTSMAALFHSARGGNLELGFLDSCLEQLASGPRHAGSSLQRANLHRLAAEQAASGGSVLCALNHATEAHRLAAAAAASHAQSTAGAPAPGLVGWWQLAAEQLCSLMQLGRLFELSGMADEALQAFKEGLRMATSIGSQPLAAAFQVMLADIYSKQGRAAVAQSSLRAARGLLEAGLTEGPILSLLTAQLRLVEARLSLVASEHDAAMEHWQAAVGLCAKASAAAASEPSLAAQLAAVQASAVLASAQCLAAEGDALGSARAAQHAAQLLSSSSDFGPWGSGSGLQPWAEVLLFQALPAAKASTGTQQQGMELWGLQPGSGPQDSSSSKAAAPKAAGKKPTGRGGARGRATKQPAEELVAAGSSGIGSLQQQQQLWQAYWVTREVPHMNRIAAAHLASECGRAGYVHLAALLLHTSLGATLRQQYRLVLLTKLRQLEQRAGKAAAPDAEEQCCVLRAALSELDSPLDAQLVCQLAGLDAASGQVVQQQQQQAGRCRAAAHAARTPQEVLAELERQAEAALRRWVDALPEGTVVCSVSSEAAVGSSFLPAGSKGEGLIVSRIAAGAPPVIVRLPAGESQRGGLKQHPIKALSLGEEDGDVTGANRAAHPLAADMHWLLEESGRSMRDMATDTREQQRDWWRARLGLDDQLAALLQAMDSSWLGCWRCLLLGAGSECQEQAKAADRLIQQLQSYLAQSSSQALAEQQLAVLRAALVSVLQSGGGPESPHMQEACAQLCKCLGLELSQEQVAAVLRSASEEGSPSSEAGSSSSSSNPATQPGRRTGGRAAVAGARQRASSSAARADGSEQLESSSMSSGRVAAPKAAAPAQGRRAKTVTFQVEESSSQPEQPPQRQPSRSQRSSARDRAAAAAAAAAAATPAERDLSAAETGPSCSSAAAAAPGEAAAAAGQPDDNLCEALGAMSLDPGLGKPQALTTARASKHRSRLKMMQASTPGPGTASTAARGAGTAAKASTTAPRLRRCVSAAALGEDAASSTAEVDGSGAAPQTQRGPVVLVLDGSLQALPWESIPGLRRQRIYRIPSLACAVACAQRSAREVDLSSTFYALNPSGDLTATQSAFQDWFRRLPWEGKVGEPPTSAELASALQSHQLFVYFGHGGGDQYIPAGKLRSLDSCSAALLMGCSSGRLCPRQHYEPAGPVLAYLLAGCPTAVANLWDVTDKDIDRFSQALLSSWLDRKGEECPQDISAAVAASRAACKLPHLIGAAPVCYGVPTSVQ